MQTAKVASRRETKDENAILTEPEIISLNMKNNSSVSTLPAKSIFSNRRSSQYISKASRANHLEAAKEKDAAAYQKVIGQASHRRGGQLEQPPKQCVHSSPDSPKSNLSHNSFDQGSVKDRELE